MMMGDSGMPGVFFSYELAPVMVSSGGARIVYQKNRKIKILIFPHKLI